MSRMQGWGWILASVVALAAVDGWLALRKRSEKGVLDPAVELLHTIRAVPDLGSFQVKARVIV